MHSIIVSCLGEEPLLTAEQVTSTQPEDETWSQRDEALPRLRPPLCFSFVQVIEEIEEIMQDSSDVEVEHRPSRSGLHTLCADIRRAAGSPGFEKGECDRSSMWCYKPVVACEMLTSRLRLDSLPPRKFLDILAS